MLFTKENATEMENLLLSLKIHYNILEARKHQNLKYQDIFLAQKIDGISGFRMDCYRRFKMACETVDKMVNTAQDTNTNSSRIMRSEVTSPKPSSTVIFPKLGIIIIIICII